MGKEEPRTPVPRSQAGGLLSARMQGRQSHFSSTRPVVVLNVYVAPPSWCLASADQAAVAGLTILISLILHAIGVLDYPFNSGVRVQPDAFEQVLRAVGGRGGP
jgi:hypothetical protein